MMQLWQCLSSMTAITALSMQQSMRATSELFDRIYGNKYEIFTPAIHPALQTKQQV